MKLIYRKADGLIGGTVQTPQSEALEVQNICRSELGGRPSDWGLVEAPPRLRGQVYKVSSTGVAAVVDDPALAQRKAVHDSTVRWLMGLGATAEQAAHLCP